MHGNTNFPSAIQKVLCIYTHAQLFPKFHCQKTLLCLTWLHETRNKIHTEPRRLVIRSDTDNISDLYS